MTVKNEKPETKTVADQKPQGSATATAGTEIAEETLDTVVGGLARRGPRMS